MNDKNTHKKEDTYTGIIKTTSKGMGYVSIEGYDEDIVIQSEFLNTALNNDEVEISITGLYFDTRKNRQGQARNRTSAQEATTKQYAGQVTKIIKRAKKNFVGTLALREGRFGVLADDKKMYAGILVKPTEEYPEEKLKELIDKKILVHIAEWKKGEPNPIGAIVEVLGDKGNNETEIQSIILDRGIDTHFPPEVDAEANTIEKTEKPLKDSEIAKRKDMRGTFTSTIDPVDAKDFDDAISFKELPSKDGKKMYEIGVHIADVSYYVRENTALDTEAKKRAFSVYLVDRTIPMLPEVLSNDLCSLNPHEDKFAFSAIFVMDEDATIVERWFGRTIINSDKRFTYETAQESLNNTSGEYHREITELNIIAKKLEKENYRNGAIDFATDEVKFKLDENGKPIGVYKKERLDTHKLVEEYMLLANKEVAAFIFKEQKGKGESLYRIHDLPDSERLEELALFIQALGFHLPVKQGKIKASDINTLLESLAGKPEESLIKTATIRSMAKAIYSPRNIGHFGLGFEYYTHFTSPIRRYPDLMVHRVLQEVLDKKAYPEKNIKPEYTLQELERIAKNSSEREVAAAEAERASIKLKQVEYMSQFVGKEFDGVISGVTEWGLYIEEKDTKCEGMVPLRELGNDFFVFNKKTYSVKGDQTKKEYRLGDSVRFKVMKADLDNKTLDYKLV